MCTNNYHLYESLSYTAGVQEDDSGVVSAICPLAVVTPLTSADSAEPPTPPKGTTTPVQKDEVASLACAMEDVSVSVDAAPNKGVGIEATLKFRLSQSNCVLLVLADSIVVD